MHIRLYLFANFVEHENTDHLDLELPDSLTVNQLRELLALRDDFYKHMMQTTLIAVNHAYAPSDRLLEEGDEVALIPPIGGGAPSSDRSVLLTDQPLDIARAYEHLVDSRFGGTALFVGTVREWTKNRQTDYLEYTAYPEMGLAQMRQIISEVTADIKDAKGLMWHRTGRLYKTDVVVVCGAASPHRDDAFKMCRTLIERLKKEVPIWKKEMYLDGEFTWQPNP